MRHSLYDCTNLTHLSLALMLAHRATRHCRLVAARAVAALVARREEGAHLAYLARNLAISALLARRVDYTVHAKRGKRAQAAHTRLRKAEPRRLATGRPATIVLWKQAHDIEVAVTQRALAVLTVSAVSSASVSLVKPTEQRSRPPPPSAMRKS